MIFILFVQSQTENFSGHFLKNFHHNKEMRLHLYVVYTFCPLVVPSGDVNQVHRLIFSQA